MTEKGQYLTALEIAKNLNDACDSKTEAECILALVGKLVELRWPISQKQS